MGGEFSIDSIRWSVPPGLLCLCQSSRITPVPSPLQPTRTQFLNRRNYHVVIHTAVYRVRLEKFSKLSLSSGPPLVESMAGKARFARLRVLCTRPSINDESPVSPLFLPC